jgi:TRAP-type uncharacterized transport system substrate-binding protein
MSKLTKFFLFAVIMLTTHLAVAQENKILVAAASSSGTYSTMLKEVSEFCNSNDLTIQEVPISGGATDNLNALVNNKVSLAFLHSDVIFAMSQTDAKYKALKTLVALYPEEIHFIALRNSNVKKGGTLGFGAKEISFTNVADLRGYKVGAAGGGAITAKLLQGQGEAGFSVIVKDTGKELLPALDSGEVQAVLFVGGAPLANIESLDGSKYKLLSIPESIANKVKTVYHSATVNYPNLKSGPIATLAPDAIVLTRQYKSPRMVAPQRKFRACFYQSLNDLKETPGKHSKWQAVNPDEHGSWDWYELPSFGEAPSLPPNAPVVRKK